MFRIFNFLLYYFNFYMLKIKRFFKKRFKSKSSSLSVLFFLNNPSKKNNIVLQINPRILKIEKKPLSVIFRKQFLLNNFDSNSSILNFFLSNFKPFISKTRLYFTVFLFFILFIFHFFYPFIYSYLLFDHFFITLYDDAIFFDSHLSFDKFYRIVYHKFFANRRFKFFIPRGYDVIYTKYLHHMIYLDYVRVYFIKTFPTGLWLDYFGVRRGVVKNNFLYSIKIFSYSIIYELKMDACSAFVRQWRDTFLSFNFFELYKIYNFCFLHFALFFQKDFRFFSLDEYFLNIKLYFYYFAWGVFYNKLFVYFFSKLFLEEQIFFFRWVLIQRFNIFIPTLPIWDNFFLNITYFYSDFFFLEKSDVFFKKNLFLDFTQDNKTKSLDVYEGYHKKSRRLKRWLVSQAGGPKIQKSLKVLESFSLRVFKKNDIKHSIFVSTYNMRWISLHEYLGDEFFSDITEESTRRRVRPLLYVKKRDRRYSIVKVRRSRFIKKFLSLRTERSWNYTRQDYTKDLYDFKFNRIINDNVDYY